MRSALLLHFVSVLALAALGAIALPTLRPVETKANTVPIADFGAIDRTSRSRDGRIAPCKAPIVTNIANNIATGKATVPADPAMSADNTRAYPTIEL